MLVTPARPAKGSGVIWEACTWHIERDTRAVRTMADALLTPRMGALQCSGNVQKRPQPARGTMATGCTMQHARALGGHSYLPALRSVPDMPWGQFPATVAPTHCRVRLHSRPQLYTYTRTARSQ